ncbi:MAG TPA: response regulator [Gemmatimonadaceae bacterium]|jgi:two-component system chemotaxis sensor kinase CheA|nr:response regulator [Gemmatimonadaceae bacterium]
MVLDAYRYFRVEARDLHEQLGRGALELEKDGATHELVARMLRLAHTLKGAARVVKQLGIAEGAHAIEDALEPFRQSPAAPHRDEINAILRLLDDIERGVVALTVPPSSELVVASEVLRDAKVSIPGRDVGEMDAMLQGVAETHARLERIRDGVSAVGRARHVAELLVNQSIGAAKQKVRALAEELHQVLGALERDLGTGVDDLGRELNQVREAAEQLLLVPARSLFDVLERTARDSAVAMDKRVALDTSGGEVRLDPRVLGVVQGALMQLVKNAAAHGIESEADRLTAGKPATGRITITITRRGRLVRFTCSDDGRGVDVAAVRRAASRRGHGIGSGPTLDSDELLQLLLRGGITTAPSVSGISGRGIGLDVVREAAEQLGGDVTLVTTQGHGTTFDLVVPLSLASLEVLAVESSGVVVTIPLDAVRGTVRVTAGDLSRTACGESLMHHGRCIPFRALPRLLRVPWRTPGAERIGSAVVVEGATGTAAIGVDRVVGIATIVIRSLPSLAFAGPSVAGASIDSAGNPQLVLDPDELVVEARRDATREPEPATPRHRILVVDDSLTTRMLEQSILESAGYNVHTAVSGEDALERLSEQHYDLVLVDVEMPGMDGFTFIERLRMDAARRSIPAILVTSRSSPDDKQRGLDVGAQGYLVKSEFDQKELLGRIRRLLA